MAVAGSDVAGLNPRAMADAWLKRRNSPAMPMGQIRNPLTPPVRPAVPQRAGVSVFGGAQQFDPSQVAANPYSTALNNIRTGGSGITGQVKSQPQNAFSNAIRQTLQANQPARQNSLTNFVKDAYGRTAGAAKALDQENKALDKVFSEEGLVNELANARANRRANVMINTKRMLDRARRQNNTNRMMAGNNTYNDRLYADALAGIAVDAGTQDADLEREDIRYMQGQRMGALGGRDTLLRNYLSTSMIPMNAQRQFLMEDIGAADALGQLEDRNTIYETPEQRQQREIRMADGTQYLNDQVEASQPLPPAPASRYAPPAYNPMPYPRYGSPVPTMPYGGPLRTGRGARQIPRFNNLRYAV